jgi:hypothetical protein
MSATFKYYPATFKFKYYQDPGHGWGAVKRNVLVDLGILNKISPFSYQKGDTVYLEEDCDLSTLTTALSNKGIWVEHVSKHTNGRSPIRNYASFQA